MQMAKDRPLQSDILLLITSAIWGFSFVAQRVGMQYIPPFTFNAIRFALGALLILSVITLWKRGIRPGEEHTLLEKDPTPRSALLLKGIVLGLILFAGASLQQTGIVYTTAGKAGFITGLYVILVPIIGLLFKSKPGRYTWIGAALATVGLYLLSFKGPFSIVLGDSLVLAGAFFWALHVIAVGAFSKRMDPFFLAFTQFAVCSALSAISAIVFEDTSFAAVRAAAWSILYSGILSVGVAFTLQVIAQRKAPPSHAAIIMSLESVFAAVGGWLILDETIPIRGLVGCFLMLAGIMASQKAQAKSTSLQEPF